jgi:V/A-type H+-transporting ATPase subunit I
MKKASLVVMDRDREPSLEKLRELGVLHLQRKSVSSAVLSGLLEKRAKTEAALAVVRSVEAPKKTARAAGTTGTAGTENPEAAANPAAKILELGEERKRLQDELASLARERSRVENWGDFDPEAFAEFAAKGIVLVPYLLPRKSYEALGNDTRIIVLGEDKIGVYVLSAGKEIPGETPFALSEYSLSGIDTRAEETRKRIAAVEEQLVFLAAFRPAVEAEKLSLDEQIEFETARAGMDVLDGAPAEHAVSWLSGFIPAEDLGVLKRGAAENGWALIADDPGPDDEVPTKLKNNRFANLIGPLTGFLEVVPGYHEVDISGWFLFFFVIFFGMIFGDAGYGALLLLSGAAALAATVKKGVPPVVKLLLLLGFSNFVWGVLTCSWFGIEVKYLPGVLQNVSLPLISNVTSNASEYGKKIVQQNLMIFCFSLALLQLSIGHILAIFHNKSLKALGDLGNIAMLTGMYFIILNLIASNEARQIPLFPPAVYILAGGFFLNFVFGNYSGSIGRSITESLKNIISVILGIANVFSDIMSYIRLWAVGLAGAAIADTVDKMAGPMLGHFLFFVFGILLLVFGHGLNLVLNMLSVLVHGVRLNTLEFSGHVGLTWAGSAYKPFSKRIKNEAQSA